MMSRATGEPRAGSQSSDDVEVAVIGAGQAGLAMGYFLRRQGRRFVILERAGFDRPCLAGALGVADALHAPALQRAAGACLFRATRTATRPGTR